MQKIGVNMKPFEDILHRLYDDPVHYPPRVFGLGMECSGE